jgi:hypothetical protein
MATAKLNTIGRRGTWPRALLVLAALAGGSAWYFREPIAGLSTVGAAFGARTACSCRYVAGRGIADCEKDFEPGMGIVFLSDDPESRSVTARVPLLASATAQYREGFGCLLEPWDG